MFRLIKAELGAEYVEVLHGESVLGRGPFLKVTDKRVSRNHALLVCTGEKLELVPKHKNPCFYRKNGSSNFTILGQDVSQLLQDGDQFSLLPKELIFKVEKIITLADKSHPCLNSKEEVAVDEEKGLVEEKEESVERPEESLTDSKQDVSPLVTQKTTEDTGANCKPRKLPSWLLAAAVGGGEAKKEVKKAKRAKSPPEVVPDSKRTAVAKKDTLKPIATKKKISKDPSDSRPYDDDNDDEMTDVVFSDKLVATEEKISKNPSDSRAYDDDEVTDVVVSDKPTASATAVDKKLPQCLYGKKCYRKNPVHFNDYSHDFDDDVIGNDIIDDDDKPACPYGTACYRKNPLHRKQYSHNAPPMPDIGDSTRTSKRSKRKAKVSALAGDSDDDGEANTYDYNDSFINDADQSSEESTEYGGESEDSDWGPGDNEDVSELVDEAKDFMLNKKMLKPT